MFAGNQLTELDLIGPESYDKGLLELRGVVSFSNTIETSLHSILQCSD